MVAHVRILLPVGMGGGAAAAYNRILDDLQALGIIMIMIYLHIFFAPYRRMKLALITHDFIEAGKRLGQIRKLIALNLSLGLVTIIVAIGGKNWGLAEIILTPLFPR